MTKINSFKYMSHLIYAQENYQKIYLNYTLKYFNLYEHVQ